VSDKAVDDLSPEELLVFGLNHVNEAIICWEKALGSIESASYMRSKVLALPSDEHSDLVFKLRSLIENANNLNFECENRLIKSSEALQIIQYRIQMKQQMQQQKELKPRARLPSTKSNVFSDIDDNDSYTSAISDAEWVDDDEVQISLYEIGLKEAKAGKVSCREIRTKLTNCENDTDFYAKLYALRLGFSKLTENEVKKRWLVSEGRQLLVNLMRKAEKNPDKILHAYDKMIVFVQCQQNWSLMTDELATRKLYNLTFFDIVIDFILLDAFDDLENPPSTICAVINNRWLSQGFKESALSTAVWSVLKAKRKILKYPNGFISHFYSINEHLVPVLAWGFLGNDPNLKAICTSLKDQVVEYLKCLFDLNITNYSHISNLTKDIEMHTEKHLRALTF